MLEDRNTIHSIYHHCVRRFCTGPRKTGRSTILACLIICGLPCALTWLHSLHLLAHVQLSTGGPRPIGYGGPGLGRVAINRKSVTSYSFIIQHDLFLCLKKSRFVNLFYLRKNKLNHLWWREEKDYDCFSFICVFFFFENNFFFSTVSICLEWNIAV